LPKQFDDYDMKSLKFISDYYNILLYDGSYAQTFATLTLSLLQTKMELAKTRQLGDKKWSIFFPK
jgi:phosphoserine aminotransferase